MQIVKALSCILKRQRYKTNIQSKLQKPEHRNNLISDPFHEICTLARKTSQHIHNGDPQPNTKLHPLQREPHSNVSHETSYLAGTIMIHKCRTGRFAPDELSNEPRNALTMQPRELGNGVGWGRGATIVSLGRYGVIYDHRSANKRLNLLDQTLRSAVIYDGTNQKSLADRKAFVAFDCFVAWVWCQCQVFFCK